MNFKKLPIFLFIAFFLFLGITKTSFAITRNLYWVNGTGAWSDDYLHWATSSGGVAESGNLPTASDDVYFDNNSSSTSYTVHIDLPAIIQSLVMAPPSSGQITLDGSATLTVYGGLTLPATGMINSYTGNITFKETNIYGIESYGNSFASNIIIDGVGGAGQLNQSLNTSGSITLTNGAFNANDFDVSASSFVSNNTNTRGLTMGSGTWTLTGTGSIWDITDPTGLTFDSGSSTIVVNNTTAAEKDFYGGGLTYNNITFSGDNILISGNNNFNNFNVDNAGLTNGLIFETGVNNVQGVINLTTNATSTSNRSIIQSSDSGIAFYLYNNSNEVISVDYMSIQNSYAVGGSNIWYAGSHSIDLGHNLGWTFTAPPITISATAIAGVTPPVTGATPVTTVTAGTGYTGTVAWSGSPSTFASATSYTATITLTPTSGYTLTGVTENQFTIAGSTSDTNPTSSGVITAVFPATAVAGHRRITTTDYSSVVTSSSSISIPLLPTARNTSTSTATTTQIVVTKSSSTMNIIPMITNPTTPQTTPTYQFSFTKILKLGSTGDEVKQLQVFLNTHGFPISQKGNGSKGHETNYFGQKTKDALIKFQEANVKDILAPQNLKKGTGIFWMYSKKFVNEILNK